MTRTLPQASPIPHVEVRRKVAVFRTSLAKCNPEIQRFVDAVTSALALRLLDGNGAKLQDITIATEYAHAVIAEAIIRG